MKSKIIKLKGRATMEVVEQLFQRWSNRANFLKSIMYNDNETEERRKKALKAFAPYFIILTNMFQQVASEEIQRANTQKFESGGISMGEVHQNEVVLNKKYGTHLKIKL